MISAVRRIFDFWLDRLLLGSRKILVELLLLEIDIGRNNIINIRTGNKLVIFLICDLPTTVSFHATYI